MAASSISVPDEACGFRTEVAPNEWTQPAGKPGWRSSQAASRTLNGYSLTGDSAAEL
jgi:hypothetical protein